MLKQVQLSPSAGLSVSQLCLGTMNFGIPGRGHQGDWTLDVDAARPIFESAKTLGLTYLIAQTFTVWVRPRRSWVNSCLKFMRVMNLS